MKSTFVLILFFCLVTSEIWTQQQRPDTDFQITIASPKYNKEKTALIGIDASHNNLHKADGGFQPFAKLMKTDGYQIQSVSRITAENLKELNTFVIVNALHQSNVGNWKRPIASAFTKEEVEVLNVWVSNGGSLLVIADHMPFAGASNELAESFGFSYEDGFVMAETEDWPPEIYSKKKGNLYESVLTDNIDSLAGFTGSALNAPDDAIKIASFPQNHKLLMPDEAWQFDKNTIRYDVTDLVMGAIQTYGNGKVAFFTEAAMFTAQIVQDRFKVGFNSPKAPQNKEFILNVMHWLDNGKTQERVNIDKSEKLIVKELLDRQANAYEGNRMTEVANYYTRDAIIYEPTGNEIRGNVDITAYWKHLEGQAISWKTQILEVEKIGDQILAVCRFDIAFESDNKTVVAKSKAILTLKMEDGIYKIFRDFYMPIR